MRSDVSLTSLRSKRFCGVWEQRIIARKMERVKEGGEGKVSFLPLSQPPLPFLFGSRPIFRADKTPKIPFLGLSLLPNPRKRLLRRLSHAHIGLLLGNFYSNFSTNILHIFIYMGVSQGTVTSKLGCLFCHLHVHCNASLNASSTLSVPQTGQGLKEF